VRTPSRPRQLPVTLAALAAATALAACGGGSHHATTVGIAASPAAGSRPAGARTLDPTAPPPKAASKARQAAKGLPAVTVATVAGEQISLAQYKLAYAAEFRSLASGGIPVDPPGFAGCAAAMARQFSKLKLPKGSHVHAPGHAQLVRECRARAAGVKTGVMTQLIQRRWVALEAKAGGISVPASAVDAELVAQRKSLGGAAAYARYLARTGQTEPQIRQALELSLLQQKIQQRNLGAPVNVSTQQVAAFFNAHRAEFVLPKQPHPKLSTYAARIRLLLASQVRSQRASAAGTAYQRRWRAQTICSPGYVVTLCANAPS
jgi:SurA N-terminal domain